MAWVSHPRETFGRIALEKPLRGEHTCIAGFHELVLGSQRLIPKLKDSYELQLKLQAIMLDSRCARNLPAFKGTSLSAD